MALSLCLNMIVKNEAKIIARSLRSVRPFITSYAISDTGSTDGTEEVIRQELAGIPGEIHHEPWVDFSHNRNLALSHATGDYVLLMDADEVLEHSGGEIELLPQFDGFHISLRLGDMVYSKVKVVRNDGRWTYEGRTHEFIGHTPEPNLSMIPNLRIMEYDDSYSRVTGEKFLRDLAVFESEPTTPRNLFYHAQTLKALGRHEEAYEKYVARAEAGGWEEEVYYSLWMAGNLLAAMKRPLDEIAGALYRAYTYRPARYEALVELSHVLGEALRNEERYRLTAFTPVTPTDILFVDARATWRILEEHALAAFYTGRIQEAKEWFERILEFDLSERDRERTVRNIDFCL